MIVKVKEFITDYYPHVDFYRAMIKIEFARIVILDFRDVNEGCIKHSTLATLVIKIRTKVEKLFIKNIPENLRETFEQLNFHKIAEFI